MPVSHEEYLFQKLEDLKAYRENLEFENRIRIAEYKIKTEITISQIMSIENQLRDHKKGE